MRYSGGKKKLLDEDYDRIIDLKNDVKARAFGVLQHAPEVACSNLTRKEFMVMRFLCFAVYLKNRFISFHDDLGMKVPELENLIGTKKLEEKLSKFQADNAVYNAARDAEKL